MVGSPENCTFDFFWPLSLASFSPPCLTCNSGSVKIIRFVNDHTFCQEEVGFEPCVIEKMKLKVGLQELSEFYLQHNLEALTVNTATNMLDFFDVNHFIRADDFLLFASSPSPPHLDIDHPF